MTWTQTATLRVDCRCTLGEGIIWWPARDALLWTDIEASRLWMQRREHDARSWALPDRLGSMAVCASGKLLLGLAKGLFLADVDESRDRLEPTELVPVEPELRTRINDGRVDRAGNFVFGTMDLAKKHGIGSFYQYSARYGLRRLDLEPVAISNSICFSPDGRTMYFCDSPRRRIMQCEYDAATVRVSHVRTFADVAADGSPDGSIVDAAGYLWNAQWGSSTVRRYTIEGALDGEVRVPARNPSCAVLGGPNLDELYVTTARENMTEAELAGTPHAGGIYAAHVGFHGLIDIFVGDL